MVWKTTYHSPWLQKCTPAGVGIEDLWPVKLSVSNIVKRVSLYLKTNRSQIRCIIEEMSVE
jgi:hypothetical protein